MHVHRVFLPVVSKGAARLSIDVKLIGDGFKQDGVGRRHLVPVTGPGIGEQGRHPLRQHALFGRRVPQVGVRIVRVHLPRVGVVRQLPGQTHPGGGVYHYASVQL